MGTFPYYIYIFLFLSSSYIHISKNSKKNFHLIFNKFCIQFANLYHENNLSHKLQYFQQTNKWSKRIAFLLCKYKRIGFSSYPKTHPLVSMELLLKMVFYVATFEQQPSQFTPYRCQYIGKEWKKVASLLYTETPLIYSHQ